MRACIVQKAPNTPSSAFFVMGSHVIHCATKGSVAMLGAYWQIFAAGAKRKNEQ